MVLPTKTPLAPALGTVAPSLALISSWRRARGYRDCSPSRQGRSVAEIRGTGPQGGPEWGGADCGAHQQCALPLPRSRLAAPAPRPSPSGPRPGTAARRAWLPSPAPRPRKVSSHGPTPTRPLPIPFVRPGQCLHRRAGGWASGPASTVRVPGGSGAAVLGARGPRRARSGHTSARAGTWQASGTQWGDVRPSGRSSRACACESGTRARASQRPSGVKACAPLTPCLCAPHWRARRARRPDEPSLTADGEGTMRPGLAQWGWAQRTQGQMGVC